MGEIHVVTAGSYSDYHIVGVFTDKALADACARACGQEPHDVETWEANPNADQLHAGLKPWRVVMHRDGNTDGEPSRNDGMVGTVSAAEHQFDYRWHAQEYVLAVRCWASDKEHAVKIANEIRTQAIAENRWPVKEQTETDRVIAAVDADIKFRDASNEFYRFCGISSFACNSVFDPKADK